MPFDSNGNYSLPSGYLAVTGEDILPSQHNPPLEDIAAAFNSSMLRSGVAAMTGPLKGYAGSVNAPGYSFNGSASTGLYKTSTGVGLSINGTNVAEFTPSALTLANGLTLKDGGDIASANSLTLGTGSLFNITGTTAITSIATKGIGTIAILRFAAALTLTYSATDLILPTGGNITTAAGDWAMLEEYDTGKWRLLFYQRATGDSVKRVTLVPSGFKNLSIKVATTTTVTVAADFVTTTDGTSFQSTAVSSTVDLGTTGADALDAGTIATDTWYAIWVVAKADGTTKCVASTSASSPTMPSGYTYKARIGWVRTVNATATLYGTWQLGRRVQYVVGLASTGSSLPIIVNSGSGSSWTSASVSNFTPSTASMIGLIPGSSNQASGNYSCIAPNSSYTFPGGVGVTGAPYYRQINGTSVGHFASDVVWMMLESTNIYYGANTGFSIFALGWEDNI